MDLTGGVAYWVVLGLGGYQTDASLALPSRCRSVDPDLYERQNPSSRKGVVECFDNCRPVMV
jgi:hypothetical protein